MKEILVSIDLTSSELTLPELQNLAGCTGSEGSFDRHQRGPGGVRNQSRLRVSSSDQTSGIAQQIKMIEDKLHAIHLGDHRRDVDVSLDIAVFASTPMASLEIPTLLLDQFPVRPSVISITYYACSDEEDQ